MTGPEIAQIFRAKRIRKGKWVARCGAHGDRTPSLAIAEGKSCVLIQCMSQQCALADICKAAGITVGDLFYHKKDDAALKKAMREQAQSAAIDDLVRECRRTLHYKRLMWGRAATGLAWLLFCHPDNKSLSDAYEYALGWCGKEYLGTWHHQEPSYSPFPSHKLLHGLSAKDFPPHLAKLLKLKP